MNCFLKGVNESVYLIPVFTLWIAANVRLCGLGWCMPLYILMEAVYEYQVNIWIVDGLDVHKKL